MKALRREGRVRRDDRDHRDPIPISLCSLYYKRPISFRTAKILGAALAFDAKPSCLHA
jgi:hypothetical protein